MQKSLPEPQRKFEEAIEKSSLPPEVKREVTQALQRQLAKHLGRPENRAALTRQAPSSPSTYFGHGTLAEFARSGTEWLRYVAKRLRCRLRCGGGTLRRQLGETGERHAAQSEPVKRLSLNLPERLHTRFKTACSATNRKMTTELQELLRRRSEELETEAQLTGAMPPAIEGSPRLSEKAARRLRAVEQALTHNDPTADIDVMLADIERGRDLR